MVTHIDLLILAWRHSSHSRGMTIRRRPQRRDLFDQPGCPHLGGASRGPARHHRHGVKRPAPSALGPAA